MGDAFDGLARAFQVLAVFATIGVVLGGYELIRLAIWLWNHVHIS